MKEKHQLFLLLVLVLFTRLYAAFNTPVIATDSILYLQNAIHISSWEFVKGLVGYTPGYPILIAMVYRMIGYPEVAGQSVSVIMGILTLLPFFGLTKEIFGRSIALMASVLFIFQPFLVQHSGETISESTCIFFVVSAVYMAWNALKYERPIFYFYFGLLTALAYLTRPEGIGFLFGFIVWFPIHYWLNRKKLNALFCGRFLFILLPFVLLALPYLYKVRQITGEWRLNAKRNMIADSGLHSAINNIPPSISSDNHTSDNQTVPHQEGKVSQNVPSQPFRGWTETRNLLEFFVRYIKTFSMLVVKFTGILHQLLFAFVIVLLIRKRFFSYNLEGESFLLFFSLFNLSAMALLYVSGRHLLQLVPLFLPWAAAGLLEISGRLEFLSFNLKLRGFQLRLSAKAILLILTIGILLPKTLSGHRVDKLPLKDAGIWIQSQKISSPSILSTDPRATFYADGRHIQLDNVKEIIPIIMRNKPDFVVIEKGKFADIPGDVIKKLQPLSFREVYEAKTPNGASA